MHYHSHVERVTFVNQISHLQTGIQNLLNYKEHLPKLKESILLSSFSPNPLSNKAVCLINLFLGTQFSILGYAISINQPMNQAIFASVLVIPIEFQMGHFKIKQNHLMQKS